MSTEKTKAAAPRTSRRWRWLGALFAVLLTGGAVYGAYWAQIVRNHQSTDDAYVGGNVVQITPQISGTVVAIGADDTQFVKAGQPLVRLDPADARELCLGLVERDVRIRRVEPHERLSRLDELRVIRADRDHRAGDLRRDLHDVAAYVGVVSRLTVP